MDKEGRRGKIKLSSLVIATFLFFILLDYHFFYMIDYPAILKGNSMNLIVAAVGIAFAVIIYAKGIIQEKELKWVYRVSWMAFCFWTAICVYSILVYPKQPMAYTIVEHVSLLYIFWTIPILYCFLKCRKKDIIFILINLVCLIWYLLLLVQFVEWVSGKNLIFIEDLFPSIRTREFGIRVSLGSFGNINILYNSNIVINSKSKKKRIIHGIIMGIGLFCMIFVQQTRGFTAIIIFCVACNMLLSANHISKKIVTLFLILSVAAVLIYFDILAKFVFSFSIHNLEGQGTTIRIEEIRYYLTCFIKNPVFGNGFTNYLYYPLVQYKSYQPYSYYYTDIGIIGLMGEVGIGAVIFYIVPVKRAINTCIRAFREDRQKYAMFIVYSLYYILTSFTLIVTDSARAISYPVYLALALYTEIVIRGNMNQNWNKGIA